MGLSPRPELDYHPIMVTLKDFPQLRQLAWNRPADACLDDAEAFALYEANWRLVDLNDMAPTERALLARLLAEQGAGLLLV